MAERFPAERFPAYTFHTPALFGDSFVTHLESALDGTHLPARTLQTTHKDRPLWVRYDLGAVGDALTKDQLLGRPLTMWRYRELLPPEPGASIVTLGEGISPALRESGGRAVAVDEAHICNWMHLAASTEGVSVGPEAAVCVGAAERGADEGWIGPDDRVVIYNGGAAQKYPDVMAHDLPRTDKDAPIDGDRIAAASRAAQ